MSAVSAKQESKIFSQRHRNTKDGVRVFLYGIYFLSPTARTTKRTPTTVRYQIKEMCRHHRNASSLSFETTRSYHRNGSSMPSKRLYSWMSSNRLVSFDVIRATVSCRVSSKRLVLVIEATPIRRRGKATIALPWPKVSAGLASILDASLLRECTRLPKSFCCRLHQRLLFGGTWILGVSDVQQAKKAKLWCIPKASPASLRQVEIN